MITPSLTFNFTSAVLDSNITFSRAGNTATRFNSSGLLETVSADTARFDYNPVTLACNGLLIEESRTNATTYSQEFKNAVWTKTNTTITDDAAVAPDGTTTADKLIATTTNALHIIDSVASSFTSGQQYTASIFAKKSELQFLQITFSSAAIALRANFNLDTGVLGTVSAGITARIVSVGNGWYRCIATGTSAATGSFKAVYGIVPAATSARFAAFAGDGTSGLFIWGSQLETGAFATSYIPSGASALVRNADVATVTGTNFSNFWNSVNGGSTVTALISNVSGISPFVQFDDGTANEIITLRGNTTNPELYIVDGGTPQAQIDAGTIAANTSYALTGWWQTNFCAARLNNNARVVDTTATIPTVTQMRIGSDGTNYLNGTIATINYYNALTGQIYTRRKNKVIFSVI